jgi:hypothetical protein
LIDKIIDGNIMQTTEGAAHRSTRLLGALRLTTDTRSNHNQAMGAVARKTTEGSLKGRDETDRASQHSPNFTKAKQKVQPLIPLIYTDKARGSAWVSQAGGVYANPFASELADGFSNTPLHSLRE